jgi:parallel beta-helix repeat protein
MSSTNLTNKHATLLALCLTGLLWQACGGGGSSSGNQKTRTVAAIHTPLPTSTPQPVVIVPSGQSIIDFVRTAPPGAKIIVSPGLYAAFTIAAGDVRGPLDLVADVTGTMTNGPAEPITIDAAGAPNAIALSGIPEGSAVLIDGFTLRGAVTAGLSVESSPGTTVQDCVIGHNQGDGVLLTASGGGLVFNNRVFDNSGAGVRALGSDHTRLINNTVYGNTAVGIAIGDTNGPSPNVEVENNIVDMNSPIGIAVDPNSITGYRADYNLNTDGYAVGVPLGAHDLSTDPQFMHPTGVAPDFHLAAGSPAIGAGDPATAVNLAGLLRSGTTQESGAPDCSSADLGYHYPTDMKCATPTRTPTARTTSGATATPTVTNNKTPTPTRKPTRTRRPTRTPKPR